MNIPFYQALDRPEDTLPSLQLEGNFLNSKLFSGDTPSKEVKKIFDTGKTFTNIHLTIEEAQSASSCKKAGKGELAENVTFKHNQRSLGGKDGR